mgnify:CR=1 FL=1
MLPLDRQPQSLCILRLSALGDATHTLPVVRAIQQHWPGTRISWIIGKLERRLLAGVDQVEFIVFDKRGGWPEVRRLRAALRGRRFDVLLHLQVAARANLLSRLVEAPVRLGWDRARSRDFHHWFSNCRVASVPMQHQVQGFLEFPRALGIAVGAPRWDLPVAADAAAWAALTDAFFPTGVRIATYRQLLLAVPDAPRRLYDLDALLWADVPFGLTGAAPSFEQYEAMELADPDFLPQATFVALDGDRWIGLGALMTGPGFLLNSMTGIAREWRGRGLARWLKLHTIRWALERNAPELRTFNDAINDAILGLNRSLGFRVESVEVRYRKDMR